MAALPNLSLSQIRSKASDIGVRRARRKPAATGYPLIDAIRERAFEHKAVPRREVALVAERAAIRVVAEVSESVCPNVPCSTQLTLIWTFQRSRAPFAI
jgi:hypothetical protein